MALQTASVEESRGGEEDAVDATEAGHCHKDRDEDGEGSVEEVCEGDGHGLGAENLRDTEGGVEGDVGEEIHDGHQDDGE